MSKHITVGYDGSPEATEALEWAANEAAVRGCGLRIVTCYRIPVAGDVQTGWIPTEAYSTLLRNADSELKAGAESVRARHPDLAVEPMLVAGAAAPGLIDGAAEGEEMVVVGASSRRGAAAFWLGSTPRALVRHAKCPVVVVRGAASRGRPDRVVVAVDASEGSDAALWWAAAEAELHDVPLHIVHAWEYPYATLETAQLQTSDLIRVDAARVLEVEAAKVNERYNLDVTTELVEGGAASAVLGAVADGDLLVVGSRGRGALRAGVFGSTVNTLLDRAAIPVVVAR
jgi:nucleotide-binding universal stress UspA family protein